MNWIKVNNEDESTLPPLDKIVHVVLVPGESGYENCRLLALGGRVYGEEGWLWAIHDDEVYERGSEGYLTADDEYHVTHWAEIEWPED